MKNVWKYTETATITSGVKSTSVSLGLGDSYSFIYTSCGQYPR